MKKLIFLLITILLCLNQANAQFPNPVDTKMGNTFPDAQNLLGHLKGGQYDKAAEIIQFYLTISNPKLEPKDFWTEIEKNKFLIELLKEHEIKLKEAINRLPAKIVTLKTTGARVTGGFSAFFPATKVADGLGTFLAERFKEELSQKYLEAFRKSIVDANTQHQFSKLLPSTYRAVVQYENVFDYKQFLNTLREAFKDDLQHMPENSLLIADSLVKKNGNQNDFLALYVAEFVIKRIPAGESPEAIFTGLRSYRHVDKLDANVADAFKFIGILSSNLSGADGRLNLSNATSLLRDYELFNSFMGLFLEKEKTQLVNLKFKGQTYYSLINNVASEHVRRGVEAMVKIRTALDVYTQITNKKFTDFVNLSMQVAPVVEQVLIAHEIGTESDIKKVFAGVNSSLRIADFASQEKYGLVIVETLNLLEVLKLQDTPFYKNFKKYGIFIANVAQAENSAQVKEALDAAALPVGSYRIKRSSAFSISLNAYAGISLGAEVRDGAPAGTDVDDVKAVASFTAPVGLAFNWSKAKNESTVSHTAFVSVIDVGAVTSFRLGDDETETLPEFTWKNILAPGAHYLLGFKNSPLSLGAGIQYGPQLRKIDGTAAEFSHSLLTYKIMLVVDIPIFNFVTKTRD